MTQDTNIPSPIVPLTKEEVRKLLEEGKKCREEIEGRIKEMRKDPYDNHNIRNDIDKLSGRISKIEKKLENILTVLEKFADDHK